MMQRIDAADLAAMSEVAPEIGKLNETGSEWWLGLFGLDKSSSYRERASQTWPRWRDHTSNPVTANMRLRAQAFERDPGGQGIGVVLGVPEENFEQYVGWVSRDRSDQITEWVGFLNRELQELWSLWDAAGRPRGPSPSQVHGAVSTSQPVPPRDQRIGRRLARGRFEVVQWIGPDALMGIALARDLEHDDDVRLTFAADVAGTAEDLRTSLGREVPGLAPIVYLGPTASDDGWASGSMMMAEQMPSGATEVAWPAGTENARALTALGARLAGQLLSVHHNRMVLGTLRPESTFMTRSGELVLLGRGERLWLMPRPNITRPAMMPPWRPGYQAPELLGMLPLMTDPAPAADVFSVGVMLAEALLGEFPYFTEYLTDLMVSQQEGRHLPLPGTPLGQLLNRCLDPDPTMRPSMEELEQGLLRKPD